MRCVEQECVIDPASIPAPCDTTSDTPCRRTSCQPASGVCEPVYVANHAGCDDGDLCTVDSCDPESMLCVHEASGETGADEICDGLDNDCDGATDAADDDLLLALCESQAGACANTKKSKAYCQGGSWFPCDAGFYALNGDNYADVDTTCDEHDNDCDGSTDEDYVPTETQCGFGACAATGELSCVEGSEQDSCVPGASGDEICNGIDDDCDTQTDEDGAALCDDDDMCTVDGCDAALEACVNLPKDCNDQDPCTQDLCDPIDGLCSNVPLDCDDANVCTADSCVDGECAYDTGINDSDPCDDEDPCTVDTTCDGGACGPGVQDPCDDGLPCTGTECVTGLGCSYETASLETLVCDDEDPCTLDTTCDGGVCAGGVTSAPGKAWERGIA